ncbi:MAG: hypothetical protein QXJ69_00755 [Desulfurococcaceae archaeon]
MDFLTLAFYLSVLSYCLGLALKALPLPFFAVKKLGRALVNESIFSCVLTFSYQIIVYLIEYFGIILGTNWGFYALWLAEKTSILLTIFAALKGIGLILSKIRLNFLVQGFLSQVIGLVSTSLTTIIATSIVSSIIHAGSSILIGLGIALHAVPFKLTRNVGSTLIAITVVFSIGLPLMPQFVNLVTSTMGYTLIAGNNVCSAYIELVDASNNSFGQAVIEGYSSGELLYRYSFNEKGVLEVNKYSGFPCFDHEVVLNVVDLKYASTLRRTQENAWNITLYLPDVIALAPNRFVLIDSNTYVNGVVRGEKSVNISLFSTDQGEFKLYVEKDDDVVVLLDNVPAENYTLETKNWYSVNYHVRSYILPPGERIVTVYLNYYATTPLDVDLYPYALRALNVDFTSPEVIIMLGTYAFIELTVLPLIYIAILLAISLNLARLLGGVSSSIAKLTVNL